MAIVNTKGSINLDGLGQTPVVMPNGKTSKGNLMSSIDTLEIAAADVDVESIFLEYEIAASDVRVDEDGQVLKVKFSREYIQYMLEVGDVELLITGKLIDGRKFRGIAGLRVIEKGRRN